MVLAAKHTKTAFGAVAKPEPGLTRRCQGERAKMEAPSVLLVSCCPAFVEETLVRGKRAAGRRLDLEYVPRLVRVITFSDYNRRPREFQGTGGLKTSEEAIRPFVSVYAFS